MISITKVFELSTGTLVKVEAANLAKAKNTNDPEKRKKAIGRAMNIRKKILAKPTGDWR